MIEAVVFDLDGTLIDVPIDYENLFKRFAQIMNTEEIQPITKTVARLDDQTRKKVFQVWEKAELAVLEDRTVNNQGMAIYERYSQKPRALVTMQGKTFVQRTLAAMPLSFKTVVTREDSLDRIEQIRIAADRLKTDFRSILFVGNTEGDALAARKIKCQFMRVGK